jgi:hypothetical protein
MLRNPRIGLALSLVLVAVSLVDLIVDHLRGRSDPVPALFTLVFAISPYVCWRRLGQS